MFELISAEPWKIRCRVEAVGRDLLCRVHGGDVHVGAVARAQWKDGRVVTDCLVVEGHREDRIARHAAHKLCEASRRSVVCIAGIHFDRLERSAIDAISAAAYDLAVRAARRVADRRLTHAAATSPLLGRIEHGAAVVQAEIETFLATPWEELVSRHRAVVNSAFDREFAGRVRLFAPLYLSNGCTNDCAYCGFRHSAAFARTTLDVEQAVREATELARRGYRILDLVTGEVPTDGFVDYVANITRAVLTRTGIRGVNLNLGSLSAGQYRRLRTAGASGYHLYQETYGATGYFRAHRSGPKRDMAARLTGLHRAIEAGFEAVGLGVLLGLGPPAFDLARMVRHAELLQQDHPGVRIGFSLPRVRQVPHGAFLPHTAVTDSAFMAAMLFLRLRFPAAHLTLTTREGRDVRDTLLPLGISKMSAGVSTSPGGYAASETGPTEQFPVSDPRSLAAVSRAIEAAGRIPVFEPGL